MIQNGIIKKVILWQRSVMNGPIRVISLKMTMVQVMLRIHLQMICREQPMRILSVCTLSTTRNTSTASWRLKSSGMTATAVHVPIISISKRSGVQRAVYRSIPMVHLLPIRQKWISRKLHCSRICPVIIPSEMTIHVLYRWIMMNRKRIIRWYISLNRQMIKSPIQM